MAIDRKKQIDRVQVIEAKIIYLNRKYDRALGPLRRSIVRQIEELRREKTILEGAINEKVQPADTGL